MSTYEENRRRLNRSRQNRSPGQSSGAQGAKNLLDEFKKLLFKGKTPFVSPQDVEREKDRRAQIGLDPDYYTNPFEDLGLMESAPEVKAARQGRIDDRLRQIEQRNVSPTASRRFDNTLEGQYQRYFKTPEFDYVFGAGARGEGAPKDAAAMEFLGNQIKAPNKDTNIASMYAAQSAMGQVNQDKLQEYFADADLPGNVKKDGATESPLQAWARENPMLAQRLYQKQQQKIQDAIPDNPAFDTGTAVRGETPGSFEQQMQYGAGSPISKSPTEYDISNRDEDDLNRRMRELGL